MCSWDPRDNVTCGMYVGSNNWNYSFEGKTTRHNFKILTCLKLGYHVCRLCTRGGMAQKDKSLCQGVGAQCRVISRFVHLSEPIWSKYINNTKYYKMKVVVFIQDSVKIIRRGAATEPVFLLASRFLLMVFFPTKIYIHVVQEGTKEYLFDVHVTYMRCAHQSISKRMNKEWVEGENSVTDLPSILPGQRGNLNNDDINKLQEQGFDADDDKLPNQYNVPEPTPVAINVPPVFNWKTDCIFFLRRAVNLKNKIYSTTNIYLCYRSTMHRSTLRPREWSTFLMLNIEKTNLEPSHKTPLIFILNKEMSYTHY